MLRSVTRGFALAGLSAGLLMAQTNGGAAMRSPYLNGLKGFDIACRADDPARAVVMCASVAKILSRRFGKPVAIRDVGSLPRSSPSAPMLNHVWMLFTVSVQGGMMKLAVKWGSTMKMGGAAPQNTSKPIRIRLDAPADQQASSILDETPFRLNSKG